MYNSLWQYRYAWGFQIGQQWIAPTFDEEDLHAPDAEPTDPCPTNVEGEGQTLLHHVMTTCPWIFPSCVDRGGEFCRLSWSCPSEALSMESIASTRINLDPPDMSSVDVSPITLAHDEPSTPRTAQNASQAFEDDDDDLSSWMYIEVYARCVPNRQKPSASR